MSAYLVKDVLKASKAVHGSADGVRAALQRGSDKEWTEKSFRQIGRSNRHGGSKSTKWKERGKATFHNSAATSKRAHEWGSDGDGNGVDQELELSGLVYVGFPAQTTESMHNKPRYGYGRRRQASEAKPEKRVSAGSTGSGGDSGASNGDGYIDGPVPVHRAGNQEEPAERGAGENKGTVNKHSKKKNNSGERRSAASRSGAGADGAGAGAGNPTTTREAYLAQL